MDRTVRIRLHPTPEQAQALKETLSQFTVAFNTVCAYGWHHHENNGVKRNKVRQASLEEVA